MGEPESEEIPDQIVHQSLSVSPNVTNSVSQKNETTA